VFDISSGKTLTIENMHVQSRDIQTRSQRSNPAERVVRVLEALRAHPDDGLRFAEVARAASVSQATCHAILASLTDAGYVAREEATKAYSLGPALVPLAAGASRTLRVGRVILPALDELAARIGLACSVAEGVGDAITLVAVAAPSGVDPLFRVGTSVPFAPPYGAIHVAWSEPAAIDAWIARAANPALTPTRLRAVVDDHRRSQVAVAPYTPAREGVRAALAELASDEQAGELRARTLDLLATIDRLDYTSNELTGTDPLPVHTITAPVFDARDSGNGRRVAFAVGVQVADPALPMLRLRELITELRHATEDMTANMSDGMNQSTGDRA
jgi:DNA-binding IclR family transcriptional regulator